MSIVDALRALGETTGVLPRGSLDLPGPVGHDPANRVVAHRARPFRGLLVGPGRHGSRRRGVRAVSAIGEGPFALGEHPHRRQAVIQERASARRSMWNTRTSPGISQPNAFTLRRIQSASVTTAMRS